MESFIKKYQFNYVNKCLIDLNSTFKNCIDENIIKTSKSYIQNKIWNNFEKLTEEEREILNIDRIDNPSQIDGYLKNLFQYVYGMPKISSSELNKIFKKEKKLKIPDLDFQDKKLVYLGWIDPAVRKLFIVYNLDGKFLGMACRLRESTNNNLNICSLCNSIGSEEEISFVSPICKTNSSNIYGYKSLGFHICLDSEKCNDKITSTEKLEELLKKVNNIK